MKKNHKRFMNASFVWWEDKARTKPYPLSPMTSDFQVISNNVLTNNDNEPMAMFIIYHNGKVGIEVLRSLYGRPDIKFAVGGIHLTDNIQYYGFEKRNIPSLDYETLRIAIASNPITGKVAMIANNDPITIEELYKKIKRLGYTKILGLDSGGSAQWSMELLSRVTSRIMILWIVWEE